MLKRSIWNELTEWKQREHHPLVIRGLRQIGKTFVVKEFGRTFYESVVYIDFRADISIHRVFEGDFNVDRMIMAISALDVNAHFIPQKTLIILDEIQDCPNARSSLKYWDLDGRYDVIATGSFLGVKGFREPYIRGIPVGYEEQITMFPLTFSEFLVNTGMNEDVIEYIDESIRDHKKIDDTIHNSMRMLYLQYLVVGGMPEAVNTFFELHDLNAVRAVQRRILTSIRDDFGRYRDIKGEFKVNEVLKLRAEACLDSLSAQLSKDYKKFQYSKVNAKGHSQEKADGLQYLVDVGLAVRAFNTLELSSPLSGVKKAKEFKVYFADTGLLISQLGDDAAALVLNGDLSAYKGAITENMVATAFMANDIDLFYYHAPSGSPELDFLIEKDSKVVIVECKSTNNRATSMKYVLANPKKYGKHKAIKYADANVGGGEGFDTYPLYALGFLERKKKPDFVPEVDVSNLKVPKGRM